MTSTANNYDVVLVGGGIMSATLGALIKLLAPERSVRVLERLDEPAVESSNPWNNAGTGHSALCELNYTPKPKGDDPVNISKALNINEQFQVSRQFWASMVESGVLGDPNAFINRVPHMSFVTGEENVDFLKKRQEALVESPLFAGMEYSTDHAKIAEWIPLVMNGRDPKQVIAATRAEQGTDVDFGALTKQLLGFILDKGGEISYRTHVTAVGRIHGGKGWSITYRDQNTGGIDSMTADFVFVGAGGGALHLLQGSGIPEITGFGGFPISGEFLRCTNDEVIAQHRAKVYGQAAVGAPPMSVPHLDTRFVDGKQSLMFGPYAGFSTKFLKNGSYWDLPASVRGANILPMLAVAKDNLDLVSYLVKEILATRSKRIESLKEYFPEANGDDWELIIAGQRVQVIKKDPKKGGVLQFGTEVVASEDGSIAGLLGASPGASTAVPIMLSLIKKCFPGDLAAWEPKLKELIPSYGTKLSDDAKTAKEISDRTAKILKIEP